jgi:hypothetical protein
MVKTLTLGQVDNLRLFADGSSERVLTTNGRRENWSASCRTYTMTVDEFRASGERNGYREVGN